MSWADLVAMLKWASPASAVFREINGQDAAWDIDAQLLATIAESVNDLAWLYLSAHTEKGRPRPARPDQIQRPGVKQRNSNKEHIGSDPIPTADFDEWWTKGYRTG